MSKLARAQKVIDTCGILEKLKLFSPQVVSTIFVGLDTETSDIDIICCFEDADQFKQAIEEHFSTYPHFQFDTRPDHCLCQFETGSFLIEIYGSTKPTDQQPAWRHYQIMKRLVTLCGAAFQEAIQNLKRQGLKTEPAICQHLKIEGGPYHAILDIENWSDEIIRERINNMHMRN